jgi:hypothetical protein
VEWEFTTKRYPAVLPQGSIHLKKKRQEENVPVRLANVQAKIVEEIIKDNGIVRPKSPSKNSIILTEKILKLFYFRL